MMLRSSSLRGPRFLLLCAALSAALALPAVAAAQPSDAARAEARERFDRGLRLFNQADNEGALAEFLRAYELVPHPLVLYNLGLVYSAVGRPVQALEAFDKLLANPAGLEADKLARVRDERARQAGSIAELEVVTNVPGAIVEVDGVEVARTPLGGPLRIASGHRVIGLMASGYSPSRKAVTVAGQTRTRLEFELIPQAAQLAHLSVATRIPGFEVLIDGERAGTTPLPASLALAPGSHKVALRRPGYVSVERVVELGPGSTGTLDLEPAVDATALATEGGELVLQISEPGAVVFVNGESRGPYTTPLRLPPGEHVLRVERGEFLPFQRPVTVNKGSSTLVRIELEPTPEKRQQYRSGNQRQRTWGWIAVGAGSAIGLGGGGFLLWNQGEKNDAKDAFDAEAAKHEEGGECDPDGLQDQECEVALRQALEDLDEKRKRDAFGWVGVGVGAAALGTGVVLLLTSDDPDRYEPRPESDVFGRVELWPRAWVSPGGGGVGMVGRF
jgi:hypothetical protein